MKNLFYAIAILISGAVFYQCKQDAPKQSAATNPAIPDASRMVRPELFLFVAAVDNLRMREEPNQSAAVLAQFREGEIVEGTGQVSANKEEIELRGIPIQAPYVEVRSTAGGNKSGWSFGGALTCVYAGSTGDSPDRTRLAEWANFIKLLNPKDLNNGGKAWNYLEQHLADARNSLADAVFILMEHFFRRMEAEGEFYQMTEKIAWTDADMEAIYGGTFDVNKYPLAKALSANGFRLATGEGAVFPILDLRKMQVFFAPKVSPAMKAYLDQNTAEQNEPVFDDGGVIVPMEKIADQAVFWEKFNQANPYFPLSAETAESQRWLRRVLINGADNTPASDYETDAINEDFKNVWAYTQQKFPDTEIGKACKQLAELCAAEGWKRTKKVEDLQSSLCPQ